MDNMLDVNDAWSEFMNGNYDCNIPKPSNMFKSTTQCKNIPKCSDLSISTKTMISYLTHSVPLEEVFWKIQITPYSTTNEVVIKKQRKFSAENEEVLKSLLEKIDDVKKAENAPYVDDCILTHINNPGGRIPFKSVRKISIGLSKKDIASYRCKKRSAFYNCFVVILRIFHNSIFREIHVKVFNTGKLEIPGIQTPGLLPKTLDLLVRILRTTTPDLYDTLNYIPEKSETVLINSNFNCGYYINRDKLYDILRKKYKINSAYDPCSYPGIQSEFYYDKTKVVQDGRQSLEGETEVKQKLNVVTNKNVCKVSFMMFRTGSVLIVGKCNEIILNEIYEFLKIILEKEFSQINNGIVQQQPDVNSIKRVSRKRSIMIYQH